MEALYLYDGTIKMYLKEIGFEFLGHQNDCQLLKKHFPRGVMFLKIDIVVASLLVTYKSTARNNSCCQYNGVYLEVKSRKYSAYDIYEIILMRTF